MNIVMVAGELSGDLLGGRLANALMNINKDIRISGIGGQNMRAAGAATLFDINDTSVVGIIEILRHYPHLRKILAVLKKHIKAQRPALLILIDYPEFNLKLAAYARRLGVSVMFYVSPQVWAWRAGRVKKIKQCVDLMAVLFPFELAFYEQENIPACLVRHPLLEDVDAFFDAGTAAKQAGKKTHIKTGVKIGLLPGSRKNEIKKLLPAMIRAGRLLMDRHRTVEFILPVAAGVDIEELKKYNCCDLPISYQQGDFYPSIYQCQAVVVASGTATLQTALLGIPMVIVYKISPLTYRLLGGLVKVDYIGLANIILNRHEFTELIQANASANNIFQCLHALLNDATITAAMTKSRAEIYQKLNAGIDSNQLAQKALALTARH